MLIKEVLGIFSELQNGLARILHQIRQEPTGTTVCTQLRLVAEAGWSLLCPCTLRSILSSMKPHLLYRNGLTLFDGIMNTSLSVVSPVWNDDNTHQQGEAATYFTRTMAFLDHHHVAGTSQLVASHVLYSPPTSYGTHKAPDWLFSGVFSQCISSQGTPPTTHIVP